TKGPTMRCRTKGRARLTISPWPRSCWRGWMTSPVMAFPAMDRRAGRGVRLAVRRWWLCLAAAQPLVDDASDQATDDRCNPEQPELGYRATTNEDRHAGGAGRIHRGVCDRNADEMDQ